MNIPDEAAVALAGGVLALGGGMIKLLTDRRKGTSTPPPARGCPIDPGDFEAVHEIITAKDTSLVPRVHNKPAVEDAIMQTAAHSKTQTELLRQIAASVAPRPPLGSHPGGE